MERGKVVIVGSHVQGLFMRVAHFPTADETVLGWDFKEALDGGKGSHQAIACARLGLKTCFVGRVGRDRLGDIGATWMSDAGVNLNYLSRSDRVPTGCGFVMINPQGVPAITTALGANAELSAADIDRAEPILAQASIVLVTLEIPLPTALYAIQRAHQLGAFTILTPGPPELLAPDALRDLDLLVPNQTEANVLTGRSPDHASAPAELAASLQNYFGLQRVVITLGKNGAFVAEGQRQQELPAFEVDVVDTPGAGDAFAAGMAFGLAGGAPLMDAVRFGCLTGGRAVTVRESIPGFATFAEINNFARIRGIQIPPAVVKV